MNKITSTWLLSYLMIAILVSCINPVDKELEKLAQAKTDSLALAAAQKILIDKDIVENNLPSDFVVMDNGVKYYVWQPDGVAQQVADFDLASFHSTSRILNGDVFQTTILKDAITADSLQWIKEGADFTKDTVFWDGDTIFTKRTDFTMHDALKLRAKSSTPFGFAFSDDSRVVPRVFNYRSSGSIINFGYSVGFRKIVEQAKDKLPLFLGTRIVAYVPSAVGYYLVTSQTGVQQIKITDDEVIKMNFVIVKIRN